jgi:hypothetical protein
VYERPGRTLNLLAQPTDQRGTMNARTALLKRMVDDGCYPIDEAAIADAILVRSLARRVMPEIVFRLPPPKPQVRSFRPHRGARSFRLHRSERRPVDRHLSAASHLARAF